MLFISTSTYWEACPFIQRLNLKKDLNIKPFQVFNNHEIILIITGIGKLKAAIGITYLFSHFPPQKEDVLINIGICGTKDGEIPVGETFLCNKITDYDSKRTYYPDLLLKAPFQEADIETFSEIVHHTHHVEGLLVDMEASGIYEAASYFLQTHQMLFIKVISDHLGDRRIGKDRIIELMDRRAQEIVDWLHHVKHGFLREDIFSPEEIEIFHLIAANLKLSLTMENQLLQLLIYDKLKNGHFRKEIKDYQSFPCQTKNEGKKYYAEIRAKII